MDTGEDVPDEPRPQRQTLRGQRPRRDTRAIVLGAVLAVAGVVVGLFALLLVTGNGSGDPTVSPPPGAQPGTRPDLPSATAPGQAAPSAAPSATASIAAAAEPSAAASSPAATPAVAQPVVRIPALTVLNNSRRSGLAAAAAADVRAAGLSVASVGNYSSGRLPVTTLFYAPGQQAAAQEVAGKLPAVRQVLPLAAGVPGGQGLTLVVTREYGA